MGTDSDPYVDDRFALIERLDRLGYIDTTATADALKTVPRHTFLPASAHERAYDDRPLPIGADQTISAPHMVAMMTDLLAPKSGDRILEIGTGCGYHAAVVAEIAGAAQVYSVEVEPSLAETARSRLARAGYDAVSVRVGDGAEGWPENAPYDAAYLTCAAPELPDAIVEQVRPRGRIVAPIGTRRQTLFRYHVGDDGIATRERHGGVRFVPLR